MDNAHFDLLYFHYHFFFFYWRIIALQNFVVFCQTTWISHRYTYSPPFWTSLPSASPSHSSGLTQSPCLSFPSHTANSRWLSISHMVMSVSCYSLHASHPLLPSPHVHKVHFLCLFLHCCPANKFFSTIFLGFPNSSVGKESTCRRPWFNSWVGKIHWIRDRLPTLLFLGFPCGSAGKESSCNAGHMGSIPELGRSLEKGKATHSSILAWRIPWTVKTWLRDFHFHHFSRFHIYALLLLLLSCFSRVWLCATP